MQQRTRHRRSDPCVREPQSGGRWGPSPTSCLSQDGPLTRPLSPLALLWRGPATVTAAEAEEGVVLATPVAGGKRGQEFTAGAVVSDQLCPPPRGQGGQFSGRQEPPPTAAGTSQRRQGGSVTSAQVETTQPLAQRFAGITGIWMCVPWTDVPPSGGKGWGKVAPFFWGAPS